MNFLKKTLLDTKNISDFSLSYFDHLYEVLRNIDMSEIERFAITLNDAREQEKTVFFIGNGGSAATASHMVNDFGVDIQKRTETQKPFRAMSLTDNSAVMLAIANDVGYENLFVNQLKIAYKEGDVLVAISASGNSENIIKAVDWVKQRNGKVVGLVGFDGGRLKELSDVVIHAKTMKGEFGPVEDVHVIVGHFMSLWLQHEIQLKGATL